MISVAFLAFVLFTSNPFMRLAVAPANGNGLNPLLQDPGLAFHPPFLYLGYVGFSMAFSFAVAALIEGRVDAAWARWVRPWTLAAWVFLTIGIVLGSWWAYYELGWGGWWYWDPVENASFMPWLVGTALLHSSIVVEKRDTLKSWTILLAILAFGLSLLGTFLVRSGVITSVHSFASDPARGVFILAILGLAVGGALTLYALRAPTMKAGSLFSPVSREGSLLLNNVLMATAAGTVLLGTLYPLFADALNLGKVSVGPPFFNSVFLPLMIPLVVTMAIGPLLAWKRGDMKLALRRLRVAVAATLVAFGLTMAFAPGSSPLLASFGMALAAWLFVGSLTEWVIRLRWGKGVSVGEAARRLVRLPRAAHGTMLAHSGLAVMIAGIVGSSAWKVESIQTMQVGDSVQVSGYEFKLDGVRSVRGPNWTAIEGTFLVSRDGKPVVTLVPEKRQYTQPPRPTTEAAIHSTGLADIYAVIGDQDGAGFVTRLYHNPLVPWLWLGAALMSLGGMVSLTDRRHRVGAPTRAHAVTAAQPAE